MGLEALGRHVLRAVAQSRREGAASRAAFALFPSASRVKSHERLCRTSRQLMKQVQQAGSASRANNALFRAAVADAAGLPRRGGLSSGSSPSANPGSTNSSAITSAGSLNAGASGRAATSERTSNRTELAVVGAARRTHADHSDRTSEGTLQSHLGTCTKLSWSEAPLEAGKEEIRS